MTGTRSKVAELTDELGGGDDVVNISSVAGGAARADNCVYTATKWGMNGWSESLRQDLLPDVRRLDIDEILFRPAGQA